MKTLAGSIIRWWYSHDLDKIENICTNWKPGFIFARLKFEFVAFILNFIGFIKGMDSCSYEFITWVLDCKKEEC